MKRLDFYILKEMLVPLIAGTIVIGFLFVTNELIWLFKEIDVSSIPREAILKFALLSAPKWYQLIFPMGVTFGSSLAISRLAREGEITAMRAAGISIGRILLPVAVVGAAYSGLSLYNSDKVTPWAGREYQRLVMEFGIRARISRIEQNQSINLPPYSANIGSVRQVGDDDLELKDILLYERPKPGQVYFYSAPSGRYSKGVWTFENPVVRIIEGESLIMVNRVKSMTINQRISLSDFFRDATQNERSNAQLWSDIQAMKKVNRIVRSTEVEFYSRFAGAATCLGFAVMGGVLAIRFRRGSAFQGFLISLVIVWLYFNVQVMSSEIVGRIGWLPPVGAAWLPFVLICVVTALASWRLS